MGTITDSVKDITRRDTLSRFLHDTEIKTNVFGGNIAAERAYRRAERIAAAIYLVTNHIPDSEPARALARRSAADLLSAILALRDDMRNPESRAVAAAEGEVRRIISLVRMLAISGKISLQNADALVAALDELGVALALSKRTFLSERIRLNKDDLAVEPSHVLDDTVSDTLRTQKVQAKKDKKATDEHPDRAVRISVRVGEILGILSAHGALSVRDIAMNMPAYSEKTIQRDLKQLMALGRVKKEGAKRWSVYSLAQQ